MLEMPESWDTYQGMLQTGCETSLKERSGLQSIEMKGVGGLKSLLTSDMEMQRLEFALRLQKLLELD